MKLFMLAILFVATSGGSSFRPQGGYGAIYPQYYQQEGRCPDVNCTENPPELQKECKDDVDCIQKEKCCNYPCDEGKKFCMKSPVTEFYSNEMRVTECIVIKNCKKWKEENKNNQVCEDNGDCTRNEKCCTIPCTGKKLCQKPVEVILNSGQPTFNPPAPPPPNAGAGFGRPM